MSMVLGSTYLRIASGETASTPFTDKDFIDKLFPNGIWDLIIQLAALLVLILIVFFVAYKPVKKMIAKRKEYIANNIAESERLKLEAEEAASKKEETIEEGKLEAERIISDARVQAEASAKAIIDEAQTEAARRKVRADEEILAAKEKSKAEVKAEIVDVAMQASSKLLGREVQSKDNERLLDEFVASLEEKEGK